MANAGSGNKPNLGATVVSGYAALNNGTTGGGSATPVTVTTREGLKAELGAVNKVIIVSGTIDLCSNIGSHLDETYFYKTDNAVSPTTYDPAAYYAVAQTWSAIDTTAPQEKARANSATAQKNWIRFDVLSNTTLIGDGTAVIKNGGLRIQTKNNIIIRNIEFQDAYDYFPQWDPTDNWNSSYDLIGIESNATNVWIDHCTFSDGDRHDNHSEMLISGKYRQHHDGAIDITKGASYITISYCYIHDHEKTNLIGGSDGTTTDRGTLKTTFHNNYYSDVGQRLPRVRYGTVHCYNNFYRNVTSYVFGVGTECAIYAEANSFENVQARVTPFPKSGYTLGVIYELNE